MKKIYRKKFNKLLEEGYIFRTPHLKFSEKDHFSATFMDKDGKVYLQASPYLPSDLVYDSIEEFEKMKEWLAEDDDLFTGHILKNHQEELKQWDTGLLNNTIHLLNRLTPLSPDALDYSLHSVQALSLIHI